MSVKEHEFTTHAEVIKFITEFQTNLRTGALGSCIFRGVSDSSFGLVPSAFRDDKKHELLELAWNQPFADLSDRLVEINQWPVHQAHSEFRALAQFFKLANRNGLTIPILDAATHKALCEQHSQYDNMFPWPPPAMMPVACVAQHYGLPTRLLDWTDDPFVALYFAVSGLVEKIAVQSHTSDSCAVWITHPRFFASFDRNDKSRQLLEEREGLTPPQNTPRLIRLPLTNNQNLLAQKGCFTTTVFSPENPDVHTPPDDTCYSPLEDVFTSQYIKRVLAGQRNFHPWFDFGESNFFKKLIIPSSLASKLLAYLHHIGYDAGTIFPGFQGIKKALDEKRSLFNLGYGRAIRTGNYDDIDAE